MLLALYSLLESGGGGSGPSSWPVSPSYLISPSSIAPVLDFRPVAPSTRQPFTIDFAIAMPTGDSIASVSASSMGVFLGNDPNAASLLWGLPSFSGTRVTQWAGPGWLQGVDYVLELSVLTAAGAEIELAGRIPCINLN